MAFICVSSLVLVVTSPPTQRCSPPLPPAALSFGFFYVLCGCYYTWLWQKSTIAYLNISSGQEWKLMWCIFVIAVLLGRLWENQNKWCPQLLCNLSLLLAKSFEHIIVDCVGPLPRTKSGNQFWWCVFPVFLFPESHSSAKDYCASCYKSLAQVFYHFWPLQSRPER